jgi:hypothetical protein
MHHGSRAVGRGESKPRARGAACLRGTKGLRKGQETSGSCPRIVGTAGTEHPQAVERAGEQAPA